MRESALQIRSLTRLESPRSDVALAVTQCLQSCQNLELQRVVCHVERGEVILCGQVSSYYLKQMAQEFVRSLAIGDRIINRLLVVEARKNCDESNDQKGFES